MWKQYWCSLKFNSNFAWYNMKNNLNSMIFLYELDFSYMNIWIIKKKIRIFLIEILFKLNKNKIE